MDSIDLILAKYGYTIDPETRVELSFAGWKPAARTASTDPHVIGPFQFLPTQAGTIANRATGDVLIPPTGRIDMRRAELCRKSLNESHFESGHE
jgi:hypothetical protein